MTTVTSAPTSTGLPANLALLAAPEVPLVTGGEIPYRHFDYAATTPSLESVWQAVRAATASYGSVHRGGGWPSELTTARVAAAREQVHTFVGARRDDTVVFTRNTTDALSLLSRCLPSDAHVVTLASEHHANLLPWRRGRTSLIPVCDSPEELVRRAAEALAALPSSTPKVLAFTAASNVTGEVLPVEQLVDVARRHHARVVLDAAQVAAHAPLDISGLDVDYVAFSGHKTYAPFGVGALIGRRDWLDAADPYLPGGGAAAYVSADAQVWATSPARHEGGTPNAIGIVALGVACRTLAATGLAVIGQCEARLREQFLDVLSALPKLRLLRMWAQAGDAVPVCSFTVDGISPELLTAALSAEHGMGIRAGAFCAHPLTRHLTGSPHEGQVPPAPAVRVSFGLGTTGEDIEALGSALQGLLRDGPRWRYAVDTGSLRPDPDPRRQSLEVSASTCAGGPR